MNKVILVGRLVKDLEVKDAKSGKKFASFALAIRMGEDKTEFVNCTAFDKQAELIAQYVKQGHFVCVAGYIHTAEVTKAGKPVMTTEGKKTYRTEVIVTDMSLCESKQKETQETEEALPYDI